MSNKSKDSTAEDEGGASEVIQRLENDDLFNKPVASRFWESVDDFELSPRSIVVFATFLFGVVGAAWHIYAAWQGQVQTFFIRPIHVLFILGLGVLVRDWSGDRRSFDHLTWKFGVDLILFGVLVAATLYPVMDPSAFQTRHGYGLYVQMDYVMAAAILLVITEMMRRILGYIFFGVSLLLFVYTIFGQYIPGMFRHGGATIAEFLTYQYMSPLALWGTPIGVMARYVVLFIIFGAFLDVSKGGMFIQRFGTRVTGGSAGGPAKIAIVTSSLMGTISGSALANITTTGSFTIPLMKRLGYSSEDAAGIEAAASSGGQFTPPIMGAVAFIMASIAQVPYLTIITLALVPAVLYYTSLFTSAHVAAKYHNLPTVPEESLPSWKEVLELSHMVIPIAILIGALVAGYSVIYAALSGIVSIWIVSSLRPSTRMNVKSFINALYNAAETSIVATVACAGAGIIVGMVQLSGLGVRMSSAIIGLSSGNVLVGLFLVMIVTVLMGLGMPTVPAYAITVAIGLPALLELGMNNLASHMFIVYFAVISLITPPVMVGTFAAASIADADSMKAGLSSVKFALLAFVIPYVFILNPDLLIVAVEVPIVELVYYILTAMAGAIFIGMGTGGFALSKLHPVSRVVIIVGGIGLLTPGIMVDLFGLVFCLGGTLVDNRRAKTQSTV